MTELKTLKDLEEIKFWDNMISERKLKAEAVKWVKWFEKNEPLSVTQDWIFKFFNLTEEDLK